MSALLIALLVALNAFIVFEPSGTTRQRGVFYAAALAWTAPMLMSFFAQHFFIAALAPLVFLAASLVGYRAGGCSDAI
jgi:hypothetical protein